MVLAALHTGEPEATNPVVSPNASDVTQPPEWACPYCRGTKFWLLQPWGYRRCVRCHPPPDAEPEHGLTITKDGVKEF